MDTLGWAMWLIFLLVAFGVGGSAERLVWTARGVVCRFRGHEWRPVGAGQACGRCERYQGPPLGQSVRRVK
jgi:hypothetical protein